ncbi:MAG: glycosyltransferase family 4 protein, partial [Solirubrobacteraceae bacterium]
MSRVVLLTPDFPPAVGGIQRYLAEAAAALARHHEVTVVTVAHPGAAAHDAAVAYCVVRTHTGWGAARTGAALAEMTAATRRARPDITIAGHLATLPSALAATRRPVACCFYGSEIWSPRMRPLLVRLGGRVRRAVCISHFTAGEVQRCGIPAQRIRFVWPGADGPPEGASPEAALRARGLWDAQADTVVPYLLSIGRLVEPHKGIDQLLRTLPALLGALPELRLVIVGDGPLRERYERIAHAGGVANAVVWAGRVDEADKGALLRGARALVLLSRASPAAAQFEGFGIALVEAALAGRPSIAGNSGGIPDAVHDGETGLLVDPSDPEAFTHAARALLEDPALATRLGDAARRRAEQEFTWPRVME